MDSLDLSAFFQTKAQASDFSSRLSSLAEKIFENDFNVEKELLDEFGVKKKDAFIIFLRENKISMESRTALKEFFIKVQQQITILPVLSLKVAFEPRDQTMRALSDWFILNIKKQVLFDIFYDPRLIAGAVIDFNGKNFDFSIRSKFDQILSDTLINKVTEDHKQSKMHHNVEDVSMGR